jgi:hypothetical protein
VSGSTWPVAMSASDEVEWPKSQSRLAVKFCLADSNTVSLANVQLRPNW